MLQSDWSKIFYACLGITNQSHLKVLLQFCSLDGYLPAGKNYFHTSNSFRDIRLNLRIPVYELDFFQTCDFCRMIKKIMVYHLKLKKAHINGLNFFWRFKKPYFSGIFRLFPRIGFSPKSLAVF